MLGVFGPPGAYVPGSDLTLKVAAIRGVESNIIEAPAMKKTGAGFVLMVSLQRS